MTQQNFLPVPVQNRADGWTPEKQWRFVEALAQTASITQAVRAVGMSVRSAHRLRQHPDAAAFRAAWDAALGQAWGLLEQVALDRAVNGEREMIEQGGLVAERRKPCSDRLLIYLLAAHERTQAAARAERAAAHKLALAEAKLAALQAGVDAAARRSGKRGAPAAPPPAPPPPPVLPDVAAARTAALRALRGHAEGFDHWPELDDTIIAHNERTAANAQPTGWRGPGDGAEDAEPEDSEHREAEAEPARDGRRRRGDPDPATIAFNFANRPRWEDYAAAERAAAERVTTGAPQHESG